MVHTASRIYRPLLGAGTAVLFLFAAYVSRLAALQASGLEALWPSNAMVLSILLLAGRSRADIATVIGGGAAGSILLHLFRGDSFFLTTTLTLANSCESGIAFLLLRLMGVRAGLVERVANLRALGLACCGAGIVASTIGGFALWGGYGTPYWEGWSSWFISGFLSALMITPAVTIGADLARGRRMRGLDGSALAEIVGVLGLVAIVTSFVFLDYPLPLTFLVAPCVLFATFRFRALGAVASVAIVTTVASVATAHGHGAIGLLLRDPGNQVLLLQLFVATNLMSALPVAAVLNERDHRTEETRAFAEHFRAVVENIGEVIFRIDVQGRWVYLNPAWEKLTGKPIEKCIGCSWLDLVEPTARAEVREWATAVLHGDQASVRRAVRLKTQSGLRWVELFIQGLCDGEGRIVGATGTLRDIDDRKRLEEHVISAKRRAEQRAREATILASTDELTGLANRRAFMRQLDREIAGATEFGWPLTVAMFDVDHFKRVNDRYGHAVGDRVLQLIASRATAVVRAGDLVGRLGGEEFGILMPGATLEDAAVVAERLRQAMENANQADDSLPQVTISIGLAAREGQRKGAELLAAADMALYAAKGEGRNRVRIAA